MKLLIFSPYPPAMSGAALATRNFVERLKLNMRIYLINYQGFFQKNNLTVLPVSPGGTYSITGGPFYIMLGFLIGFFIVKLNHINLIYSKNLSTPSITAFLVSKATRAPLIIHTSGPDIQNLEKLRILNKQGALDPIFQKINKFFIKKQLIYSSAIIANCVADQEILITRGFGRKTILIFNGIDFKLFRRNDQDRDKIRKSLNLKTNEKLIIFTGQMTWQKNLNYFERIASSFPKHKFLIVGHDKSFIHGNIIVKKRVNQKELVGYLSASDVFLITSFGEGLSNSLLEAIATKNYPISSPIVDHVNLFRFAGEGKIFHSINECEKILDNITSYSSADLLNKAETLRTYLIKNFNWTESTSKMKKLFKHIYFISNAK